MRRDLTLGCAGCRLRFSSRLTYCPVCRNPGYVIPDAINAVQPTSRAAWFGKWIIVLSMIPAMGSVVFMGVMLLRAAWPPKNSLDVVTGLLGAMGTMLGASVAVSLPLGLWFGVISVIRFVLKFIVDRPRRVLRVTIETAPRVVAQQARHPMHRLWDWLETTVRNRDSRTRHWALPAFCIFLVPQIAAEIFGSEPMIKTYSLEAFGTSLVVVGIINFMGVAVLGIFAAVFGTIAKFGYDFLNKPPSLFGYRTAPPPLVNNEALAHYSRHREQVIGTATPLDETERTALQLDAFPNLTSPLSGQPCFAFRLEGEADGQPVDDADAIPFAVVGTDQKRYVVTNTDVLVYVATESKPRSENAAAFLGARRLPQKNLDLREGLVHEGTRVRVVGRRTDLRLGPSGYRDAERRVLLDAGDGLPVVIRAMADEPS